MNTRLKKRASLGAAFARQPELVLNPSGLAPLAGKITFQTARPVCAEIRIGDGRQSWLVPTAAEPAERHEYVLLGFRPDRDHTVGVTLLDDQGRGREADWTTPIRTGPLPEDFPELTVTVRDESRMEPGFTFFGIRKSAREGAAGYGVIVALDSLGEVAWFRDTGHTVGEIKRLKNGNLIYLTFDNRAIEMDMLGNVVRQWHAERAHNADLLGAANGSIAVDAEAFHHDIVELDNGNFAVIGIERRHFADYPSSETDPAAPRRPALVVGDEIIEFQPDGAVVGRWRMLDILDPQRLGYGSLSDYWANKGVPDSRDWSHLNAVFHDSRDDSFIISARHQDAVVKFRRDGGDIVWILGNPEGWRAPWSDKLLAPQGGLEWQYHQHHPTITSRGTLLLFDNGNHRSHPFNPKQAARDSYSRVVEFAIDEEAMEVEQAWAFGGPGPDASYCPFISGAEEQPETGNILACFGGLLADEAGAVGDDPKSGVGWVRIVETRREPDGEIVFELFIDEREKGKGWDVYRARRLASLYG